MPPSALPFFLQADPGQRFCLYHEPAPDHAPRGAVLYVHPFAEELNRTRRMAALQSRALAAAGYGVLQIDLFGCGDSSGDFGEARLDLWLHDLARAHQWLRARIDGPLLLWGTRLGALLALHYGAGLSRPPDALLWWQPVSNGAAHLQQFRRVNSAARLLGGDGVQTRATVSHPACEVAGYQLAPALSDAIGTLDAYRMRPPCPLHWFEAALAGTPGAATDSQAVLGLPPGSEQLMSHWRGQGATITVHPYAGRPFWSSTEIGECPALLAATAALISPATAQP